MTKKALLTGICGQDGSYLAEYLLHLGYEVHGLIRRVSGNNFHNIQHILGDIKLHYGDLTSGDKLVGLVDGMDEVYNLAAQSHVGISNDIPEYTGNVNGLGVVRLLEAIRQSGKPIKLYQAATSEQYGSAPPPQNEDTPMQPSSPYSIAKLYAYWMVRNYRETYGMFACNGIMFNHESPRRGENFVTRKITKAVANILMGKQDKLYLGNLSPKRDWGYAPEYVMMMHRMLQYNRATDWVIGTGITHTIQDFVDEAFHWAELDPKKYVETNDALKRPNDVNYLQADCSMAKLLLGWNPVVKFEGLVHLMVEADVVAAGGVPMDKPMPELTAEWQKVA